MADCQRNNGTVPRAWNVLTGKPTSTFVASLGLGSNSFYKYALKVPLAACPRTDNRQLACKRIGSVPDKMRALYQDVVQGPLRMQHIRESPTGDPKVAYLVEPGNLYHHLLCFLPDTLELVASVGAGSNDHNDDLKPIFQGCCEFHCGSPTRLGPADVNIGVLGGEGQPLQTAVRDPAYRLQPEYVKILFVLHCLTKNKNNDNDKEDQYYQDAG